MQSLPNIERSAFRRGEYIGYCDGAQRIRRYGSGWQTYALGSADGTFQPMSARTLREMSDALAQRADMIAAEHMPTYSPDPWSPLAQSQLFGAEGA